MLVQFSKLSYSRFSESQMPGKFNGLTDAEWNFLSRLLPDDKIATGGSSLIHEVL